MTPTQASIFSTVAIFCMDPMALAAALNPKSCEYDPLHGAIAAAFMRTSGHTEATRQYGIDGSSLPRLANYCFVGTVRVIVNNNWHCYKFPDGSQIWTDATGGIFMDEPGTACDIAPNAVTLAADAVAAIDNSDESMIGDLVENVSDLALDYYKKGYVQALLDSAK